MRVLMSLPDPRARGGPPSHLYLLRDGVAEAGVEVRTFVYGGRTHDEGAIRKIVGRLVDLLALPLLVLWHRPDIVQLNSAHDKKGVMRDVFFVLVARLLGRRVVVKFHGSDLRLLDDSTPVWRFMTGIVVRWANAVCVLSREEQRAFQQRFPRAVIEHVSNILDLARYRSRADFREQYGIPTGKPLLLFVARFIESKGLREVLLAMADVRKRFDVHAALVGDGPVRSDCEALARQIGLEAHTTFTGYIPEDDTVDAYLAADMLVFPTYHQEGMPMVIFHSLACGLPVVVTRIRAAADWLEEGKNALFVPARDPERLAHAIMQLLEAPDLRVSMAEAGRSLVKRFQKEPISRRFVEIYHSVMNGRLPTGQTAAQEHGRQRL